MVKGERYSTNEGENESPETWEWKGGKERKGGEEGEEEIENESEGKKRGKEGLKGTTIMKEEKGEGFDKDITSKSGAG